MSHGVGIVCVHKRIKAAGMVERIARIRFSVGKREAEDTLVALIREAMRLVDAPCNALAPRAPKRAP